MAAAAAFIPGARDSLTAQDKVSQSSTQSVKLGPMSSAESFFGGTPGQAAGQLNREQASRLAELEEEERDDGLDAGDQQEINELRKIKSTQAVAAKPGFLDQNFNQFRGMVDAGPGQQDITNSLGSQRGLAEMFQQYSQSGGWASGQDIAQSQQFAGQIFNPQRVAMQQAFQDQQVQADRQAALMGRGTNDPILRAKLAQEQTRQGSLLEAQQGAYGAQLAQQQPDRRLGYAQQGAEVQSGLASQAMRNRLALSSLGEAMLGREREWRYQTSPKTGFTEQLSGGGLKGAATTLFSGAGTAAKIGSMM